MFHTTPARRPRPPARRASGDPAAAAAAAGARLAAAETPGLAKSSIFAPLHSSNTTGLTDHYAPRLSEKHDHDHYTSLPQSPVLRRPRPVSLLSDTSSPNAASPPPPYWRDSLVSASSSPKDAKHNPAQYMIPPPPPDPLESGPSSVRTSMLEVEGVDDSLDMDDNMATGTLTLRGMQQLIRQHEYDLANNLSSQLLAFAESPHKATLPTVFDLRASTDSPPGSATSARSRYASPLRTVPTDPSLAFSFPQPRARERDQRKALLRAEEDEARIMALEDALAEARDGEEAQRKAAARLRRDVTKLRRMLEHAEDEAERTELALSASFSSNLSIAANEPTAHASASPATRTRPSDPAASEGFAPTHDDEVGWGLTRFPEFPSTATTRQPTRVSSPSPAQTEAGAESAAAQRQTQSSGESTAGTSDETTTVKLPSRRPSAGSLTDATLPAADWQGSRRAHHSRAPSLAASIAAALSHSRTSSVAHSLGYTHSRTPSLATSLAPSQAATVTGLPVSDRPRRPLLSSSTFHSPAQSNTPTEAHKQADAPRAPLSARLTVSAPRDPSGSSLHSSKTKSPRTFLKAKPGPRRRSPYVSPRSQALGLSHARHSSITSGNASSTGHQRTRSWASTVSDSPTQMNNESGGALAESPTVPISLMPNTAGSMRDGAMDSVRSYISQVSVMAGRRTLGSELGSSFASPNKPVSPLSFNNESDDPVHSPQYASMSSAAARPRFRTPPRAFLRSLRAKRAAERAATDPHAQADSWSPHSWPTPTPAPRNDADTDTDVPRIHVDEFDTGVEADTDGEVTEVVPHDPTAHARQRVAPGDADGTPPGPSTTYLVPRADPWDEYSDRATPSPRSRALKPLLLCTRPAIHARNSSLALARARSDAGLGFTGLQPASQSGQAAAAASTSTSSAVQLQTLNLHAGRIGHGVMVGPLPPPPHVQEGQERSRAQRQRLPLTRRRRHAAAVAAAAAQAAPVTIPGRVIHDVFCLILLAIQWIEWIIILLFRLCLDIRAGPDPDMNGNPPKRFYL